MSKRLYLITAALLLLAAVPADAEPRQCAPGQIRVKVSNAAGVSMHVCRLPLRSRASRHAWESPDQVVRSSWFVPSVQPSA